ncbi:MGMT family protein [Candidatus Woesearchaeota archaeon]|nr:MGMT family protein [Candidatus Woesearchaeota archaeon]
MQKSFNQKIWNLTTKIPKGKVTTYKILAEALGTKAYRAVGHAMAKNPYAPKVPCHRVVNSNGEVGNYSGKGGKKGKIRMLEKEGIKIKNNRIVDFEKYLLNV